MNVRDAAKKLEISESLCYQLVDECRLPHFRIGAKGRRGKIVIREKDIETFLKSVRRGADE